MSLRLEHVHSLTASQSEHVRRIIDSSPGAGDNPPLSEQAVLNLASGGEVGHFLAFESADDQLVGYAQVEPESGAAELVTVSGPRVVEVAGALVAAVRDRASSGSLALWAHGRLSTAEAFARAEGWRPTRELLQMRRPLGGPTESGADEAALPADSAITIRTFRPGLDDAAWLELNSLAFSHHQEQGSWTAADLADRLTSSWFDQAGFFLAERRPHTASAQPNWSAFIGRRSIGELSPVLGEVYVLGVHPSAQGQHLGQVLLAKGLNHLRRQGLQAVLLYVEGDNIPAVRLYEKQGFSTFSVDIQYSPPLP